jgi:hypothetical protein
MANRNVTCDGLYATSALSFSQRLNEDEKERTKKIIEMNNEKRTIQNKEHKQTYRKYT